MDGCMGGSVYVCIIHAIFAKVIDLEMVELERKG